MVNKLHLNYNFIFYLVLNNLNSNFNYTFFNLLYFLIWWRKEFFKTNFKIFFKKIFLFYTFHLFLKKILYFNFLTIYKNELFFFYESLDSDQTIETEEEIKNDLTIKKTTKDNTFINFYLFKYIS